MGSYEQPEEVETKEKKVKHVQKHFEMPLLYVTLVMFWHNTAWLGRDDIAV